MQKIGSVPFFESNLFAIGSIFCHFTLCNLPFQTDAMFRKMLTIEKNIKRLEDMVSGGFKTQLREHLNVELETNSLYMYIYRLRYLRFQTDAMYRKMLTIQTDVRRFESQFHTIVDHIKRSDVAGRIDRNTAEMLEILPLDSTESYEKFIQWLQEEPDRVQIVVS